MPHSEHQSSSPLPIALEQLHEEPISPHLPSIPDHVRTKNRRKLYLDANPSYFASSDLELADPLLYDKCIRRFQTPVEREADGKKKGYAGVLEADLWRSEAKVDALKSEHQKTATNFSPSPSFPGNSARVDFLSDEDPTTKEEGEERWRHAMTQRFLDGDDAEFEYAAVDESEEWDWMERREIEERWFEDEEPAWAEGVQIGDGETGVQDF